MMLTSAMQGSTLGSKLTVPIELRAINNKVVAPRVASQPVMALNPFLLPRRGYPVRIRRTPSGFRPRVTSSVDPWAHVEASYRDSSNVKVHHDPKHNIYTLEATVPGVNADGVDIDVIDGSIKILCKSRDEDNVVLEKTFKLPSNSEGDGITAFCEDGILRVQIPEEIPEAVVVPVSTDQTGTSDRDSQITIELPGFRPADVTVSVLDGQLTVEGSSSRFQRTINRSYRLSKEADVESINASLADGILRIFVPSIEHQVDAIKVEATAPEEHASEEVKEGQKFAYKWSTNAPGLKAEDVILNVSDDGVLSLSGKVERANFSNSFARKVQLPADVATPSLIQASCVDGVLSIAVPVEALRTPEVYKVSVSNALPQDPAPQLPDPAPAAELEADVEETVEESL